MKRLNIWLMALAVGCGTTKDNGCGGTNNSRTAERYMQKQLGAEVLKVTCIVDDSEHMYLCSVDSTKGAQNFRCADSADSEAKVKCIPWFATE